MKLVIRRSNRFSRRRIQQQMSDFDFQPIMIFDANHNPIGAAVIVYRFGDSAIVRRLDGERWFCRMMAGGVLGNGWHLQSQAESDDLCLI